MSKKILLSWLFMAILCLPVLAQIQEPVSLRLNGNRFLR